MQIVYYKDPVGNFGDDLNEIIWPRLLSEVTLGAPNTVLIGIGSLLDRPHLSHVDMTNKRVFVLGSGAAYGRLPEHMEDWTFLAVRGKLTARLVGRPHAAITDAAALLARIPERLPPTQRREDILFMPHLRSVPLSNWPAVAAQAGLTFVDPQWPTDRILALYGNAKLVVTEAMHGAIVADTLRIPWIPVMISPLLSVLKWRDWLSSLDLAYKPVALPISGRLEKWKYDRMARLTRASGNSVPQVSDADATDDALIQDFERRFINDDDPVTSLSAPGGIRALAKRVIPLFDGAQIGVAARALRAIAAGECYLSSDHVFADRLAGLEHAVDRLGTELRAG